jgi:hypothetical protein
MSTLREQMEAILADAEEVVAGPDEAGLELKSLIPQLGLAMQSQGLDPSDEDQVETFIKTLKLLATTKASMLRAALKRWAPAKAAKAVKVARAAV